LFKVEEAQQFTEEVLLSSKKRGVKQGQKEEFEGVWDSKINIFFAPVLSEFRIGP
jgi:hypothetical protein